jgi:hypothetical protein
VRHLSQLAISCLLLSSLPACEVIDQVKGVATLMEEAGEHLEKDLKEPLTDERIDLFLRVTPALKEFSESAKVKWKPDPDANDIKQMATSIGALGDYAAFFESEGTRLTEYWTIFIKIYDAWALISFEEGQAEARKKLEDEKAELTAKKAAASGEEAEKLEKELERNKIALENLDKMDEARKKDTDDAKKKPYQLTDAEIDLVRKRKDEIGEALRASGYEKKKDGDEDEGKE